MSPIEQFRIVEFFSILGIPFTNSALSMAMSTIMVGNLLILWPRISSTFHTLQEIYFDFIEGMARQTIGHDYEFLMPFISTIFLFLLFGNLFGLVPGCFTFTSHILPNAIIAGLVILVVLLLGFYRQGISFVQLFCPPSVPIALIPLLAPIEIITFSMRIVSLSMRLCINMCVGHMIIKIFLMLAENFGIIGPFVGLLYIPFLAMELSVAILQAYIFTILSCIYLKDAVELHH